MAKGNVFPVLAAAAAALVLLWYLNKQKAQEGITQESTPANLAKSKAQDTAQAVGASGELRVRASTLLNQVKMASDPTAIVVSGSGGSAKTISDLIQNTPPFTVKTSESRPITAAETRMIRDLAFTYPHNLFIQDLARRASNAGTITNNDIRILSLNPETRVLSTQLAPVEVSA